MHYKKKYSLPSFNRTSLFKGNRKGHNFESADNYLRFLETFDYDNALAYLYDDCMMQVGSDAILSGKNTILGYLSRLERTVKCMEYEFSLTIEKESVKIYQGRTYFTFKNGKTNVIPTCHIIKVSGNRIRWHHIYRDSLNSFVVDATNAQ